MDDLRRRKLSPESEEALFVIWLVVGAALPGGMLVLGTGYSQEWWTPDGLRVYTTPLLLVDCLGALSVGHVVAGRFLRRWWQHTLGVTVVLLPLTLLVWLFARKSILTGFEPL